MGARAHKFDWLSGTGLALSLALTCAFATGLPANGAWAQQSLAKTPKDSPLAAASKSKKKKKQSRLDAAVAKLAAAQPAEPLPRYEPENQPTEDAAQDGAPASDAPISTGTADAAAPDADQLPDANGRRSAAAAVAQDEVPEPFSAAQSSGALERDEFAKAKRDSTRETPIDALAKTGETDPYAAPGIVSGSFLLKPTLEQGVRWTSNADSSAGGKAALQSETNVKLRAESNWSRHSLNLEASGGFRKSLSGEPVSEPTFGLSADLKLDVSTATQVNAKAEWMRTQESAVAPSLATGPFSKSNLDTLRASAGVTYDPGLFGLSGTAQVTRQSYGDVTGAMGAAVTQDDRNNTYASLTLRGSYDLSPSITPFVEVEAGRRFYDKATDSFGYDRSANRYGMRAGVAANLGEKLSGEFAAGWMTENIDDPALADVTGLDLKGTMNWSPQRGTNVALTLATTVEGATSATSSGSVLYSANATLTKAMRANLEANLALGAGVRRYVGLAPQETILSGEAGLTWWMNRYAGINGKIRHERTLSSDATRAWDATSVYLGVTLRR